MELAFYPFTTLKKNALPFDENGPWYTSGLRIGTLATTTLGMGATKMREIARIIKLVLAHSTPTRTRSDKQSLTRYTIDADIKEQAQQRVRSLLQQYPLYPELSAPGL